MMEFLLYDLKVAILVAVFYMFYRLLLSRETFHNVNRLVLLLTAVASFVLPLCVMTIHHTVTVPFVEGSVTAELPMAALVEEAAQPWWQTALVGIFLAGVVAALGHQLWSLLQVMLLIRRSEHRRQSDGVVICVTEKPVSPFSWLNYIVLSRSDYGTPSSEGMGEAAVLAHERGHIRRRHTLDLLLVDTLTALQWFNPAIWMLRQDLRAIHEYEADAAVLSHGINMRQYQYLLIQKAVGDCGYSVVNGISHSTLKNRINMMLHKKSSSASLLKLPALVPVVGITLALQAETVNDYVYQQPQKKIVKKGSQNATIVLNGQTIEVMADDKAAPARQGLKPIIVGTANPATNPLLVIDGQVATVEQMTALDPKTIDHVNVIKDEGTERVYAQHFNADTSNGIIFISTKEYVEKGGDKKVVSVKVTAKPAQEQEPYEMVEQMPEFPGGIEAMMKFLSENIRYPEAAQAAGKEGRVIVQFIVEADGAVSSAKVVRSISDDLDAEAMRVVSAMPHWTPGMHKGQAVRVMYTLPVSFRLSQPAPVPQNTATTE